MPYTIMLLCCLAIWWYGAKLFISGAAPLLGMLFEKMINKIAG